MKPTGRDTQGTAPHWRPTQPTAHDDLSARLIRETEIGLMYGLRFPERFPRIPTIEVGRGEFDPTLAQQYWVERLGIDFQIPETPDERISI